MTLLRSLTEARLAREAEISYATLAMATDYDCWYEAHGAVSVEEVVRTMQQNVTVAKAVILAAVPIIAAHVGELPYEHALKGAIMTHHDAIPDDVRQDLFPILGKYIGGPVKPVSKCCRRRRYGESACGKGDCCSTNTWLAVGVVAALGFYVYHRKYLY